MADLRAPGLPTPPVMRGVLAACAVLSLLAFAGPSRAGTEIDPEIADAQGDHVRSGTSERYDVLKAWFEPVGSSMVRIHLRVHSWDPDEIFGAYNCSDCAWVVSWEWRDHRYGAYLRPRSIETGGVRTGYEARFAFGERTSGNESVEFPYTESKTIEGALAPGQPATLTFEVPLSALPGANATSILARPVAETLRLSTSTDRWGRMDRGPDCAPVPNTTQCQDFGRDFVPPGAVMPGPPASEGPPPGDREGEASDAAAAAAGLVDDPNPEILDIAADVEHVGRDLPAFDILRAHIEPVNATTLQAVITLQGWPADRQICDACAWLVHWHWQDRAYAAYAAETFDAETSVAAMNFRVGTTESDLPGGASFPYVDLAEVRGALVPGWPARLAVDVPLGLLPGFGPGSSLTSTSAHAWVRGEGRWMEVDRGPDCEPDEASGACTAFGRDFVFADAQTALVPRAPGAPWGAALLAVAGFLVVAGGASIALLRRRASSAALGVRYRNERDLPEGAHGRARVAYDAVLGRRVVIKELAPYWMADRRVRAAFEREARVIARIQHANVVTVHDVLLDEDPPAIVMEYVDGGSLAEHIARGPFPIGVALRITSDVLAGLARVHAAGVIHRDLKPANVLLTPEGEAKIADFGLAHVAGSATTGLSTTGHQPGTPRYMAPEQVRGEPPDARTDLYGVAALLHEMATGQHYLGSAELGVLELQRAILEREVRIPPEVPVPVAVILRRGLAKRREDRFRDAADMRRAVEAARKGLGR